MELVYVDPEALPLVEGNAFTLDLQPITGEGTIK
jgi:hypothetical protein